MPRNETGYIQLDSHSCRACWKCVESCPNKVIGKTDLPFHKHARVDRPQLCNGCQKCVNVCAEDAITLIK
ncbi:MAG: 4Fe-4S dicluster domain-containing protein [Dehalococcoidales bacterium]